MRLIDADELKKMWCANCDNRHLCGGKAGCDDVKELYDMPTVDAEPVKHGGWRVEPQGRAWVIIYCSECGEGMWNRRDQQFPNYCHNCGAKMDKGEE